MTEFEAIDARLARMHGYEPVRAGSSLPMLQRCGARQGGDGPSVWELQPVYSHESIPAQAGEHLPVAESGARPDVRPLADDAAVWGG